MLSCQHRPKQSKTTTRSLQASPTICPKHEEPRRFCDWRRACAQERSDWTPSDPSSALYEQRARDHGKSTISKAKVKVVLHKEHLKGSKDKNSKNNNDANIQALQPVQYERDEVHQVLAKEGVHAQPSQPARGPPPPGPPAQDGQVLRAGTTYGAAVPLQPFQSSESSHSAQSIFLALLAMASGVAIVICYFGQDTMDGAAQVELSETYTAGKLFRAYGYRPSAEGREVGQVRQVGQGWPLAVFLHGTRRAHDDAFGAEAARYLAQNGFVALSVEYANEAYPGGCDEFDARSRQVAEGLRHFCSRPDLGINCALGVAVLGFSLGGQIALKLRNFNANVSAALSIAGSILFEGQCLMSHDFVLERSKRRITVGSDDRHYGSLVKCVGSSGYDCGSNHCIQPDGSGFYMVTEDEIGRSPHHNYYIDPLTQGMAQDFKSSEAPWGFAACVRWLVGASSAQCTQ
ncbi:unnamed protein product [Symbiodinium natans]|uniref:Uncharacterized protein n=1 Tax=Symbiodinium natans TaxID=878477 RepID=A0A812NDY4_9DINO|nr:unnamed protein product [Symbiodinium natans]